MGLDGLYGTFQLYDSVPTEGLLEKYGPKTRKYFHFVPNAQQIWLHVTCYGEDVPWWKCPVLGADPVEAKEDRIYGPQKLVTVYSQICTGVDSPSK